MSLPPLKIKGKEIPVSVIQGGMGVGVSLEPLASAVAQEGGIGVISSAALHNIYSRRKGKKIKPHQAAYEEVALAKEKSEGKGAIGINIMVYLERDFDESVKGALDAGVDCIISGAGLPLTLPKIKDPKDTALIPIVISGQVLRILCKRWERIGYRPDACVLEGPMAGGHLGFKVADIGSEEKKLENLLPETKEVAMQYGDFPVIVAGGVYTHEDRSKFHRLGADGVQIGTRFLATEQSTAHPAYKQAVINCQQKDIVIADALTNPPGSPCRFPFRVIRHSPMFLRSKYREPLCNKGLVLQKDPKGKYTLCPAKDDCEKYFCICNGLLSSAGYGDQEEPPLWTVGSNGWRVDKILSVKELMGRLRGEIPEN